MDALVVEDLTKRYGLTAPVDGLSLAVRRGSVCGFLGPNGAGKTTALPILFGLARATSGSAAAHGTVSGVLGQDGFHPARLVRDELALAATRNGVSADLNGLEAFVDQRVGACSLRCEICAPGCRRTRGRAGRCCCPATCWRTSPPRATAWW